MERGSEAEQIVEQRWFVGAHGNVGGGSGDRTLSDLALVWMLAKAEAAGLAIDPGQIPMVGPANQLGRSINSYATFLGGLYARTHPIYFRPITIAAGSAQTIDDSVLSRKASDPSYNPRNDGFPRRKEFPHETHP